ncbi:uncharacterized protein LOC134232607 [Saccostrea cucullata]|uniref:uncharacterized protein LOC134232607 n=1 Tax=Saccostrea cuccullata TaxID=36930 RepID=UPI002ED06785
MASRDNLKKVNKTALQKMCKDIGFDVKGKKKEELVDFLFTNGVPVQHITPVVDQNSNLTGLFPTLDDQVQVCNSILPPFNQSIYTTVPYAQLPCPSFAYIYNFMVTRARASCADRGVQNFKGMDRAVKHFEAGDVHDIQISQVNEEIVYIKASCLASMKKDRYTVYLCLTVNTKESTVQYAYCQCPVGLAQSCSHIGGLLFALNGKHRLKCPSSDESCTSQLWQWIVPRNLNQSPKLISQLSFAKPQLESEPEKMTSLDFDPRHPQDRCFDMQYTLNQLKELKKVFPNTGLTHLWNIPDDVPDVAEEVTISTEVDPRTLEMEKLVFKHGNVPPLTIENDLVQFIEFSTRGQRLCPVA